VGTGFPSENATNQGSEDPSGATHACLEAEPVAPSPIGFAAAFGRIFEVASGQ
jgi:hypothetical protein